MTICPKCNQPSTSDKVCSNCWATLTIKRRSGNSTSDDWDKKWRDIFILGVVAIAAIFLLNMLVDSFKPQVPTNPVTQQQSPVPAPSVTNPNP